MELNNIEYTELTGDGDVNIKLNNGVLIIVNDFGNFITYAGDYDGSIQITAKEMDFVDETCKRFSKHGIQYDKDEVLFI